MLPQQEEVVTLLFVISIPDLQGHLPSGEASCPADSTPHPPQSCSTPRALGCPLPLHKGGAEAEDTPRVTAFAGCGRAGTPAQFSWGILL